MLRTALFAFLLAVAPAYAGDAAVVEIGIENMSCPVCARTVAERLRKVPGVATADVSLRKKRATVALAENAPVDPATLKQAIADAGFKPGAVVIRGNR